MSLQIPIYIVNLKKDTDKKEHIKKLLKKYHLNAKFVDAVYGKDLTESYINEVYDKELALNTLKRPMSRGEIGCSLSHINIYKEIVNKNIERAIILEDDAYFDSRFIEVLENIHKLPEDWDCILLGHYRHSFRKLDTAHSIWKSLKITQKHSVSRLTEYAYGTHGYLINIYGAKKLLFANKKIFKPIDLITGNDIYSNMYGITPPCIVPDPILSLDSNLHEEREESSNSKSSNRNKLKTTLIYKTLKLFYDYLYSIPHRINHKLLLFKFPKNYNKDKI